MPDPLVIVFGLGATLGFGIAPRPAVGMTADVGLHWSFDNAPLDGFSIALGARWDPPAAMDVPELGPRVRMNTSRLLATVAPCVHWWKLFGCAAGELGQLQLGSETMRFENDRCIYAALGGRFGAEVPLVPHFGFRGFGELVAAITPIRVDTFYGPLWTMPIVSGSVGAGVYFFF